MLTQKQVKEVREHLDKAQNPLFFFDNDQDGLCSFLLLQRYIGRGKGVSVKSFPDLGIDYFRKINELNADYIFILDKPVVSEEFFEEIEKINIPVVWIDHHEIQVKVPEFVDYYNPLYKSKGVSKSGKVFGEPVAYLCYQITQKKEDLWIAVIGCVSDNFLPEFYSEFEKEYPDLSVMPGKEKKAFDVYYKSEIGKVCRLFSAGLKDKTSNVVSMLKFLMKARNPYEVLEETSKNCFIHQRFEKIDKRRRKLINKAMETKDVYTNLLYFQYAGDTSMSSELSNELRYNFPDKTVVVVYIKGVKANVSMRGKKVRDVILKITEELEDARGGGHENAVGGQVRTEDLEIFREMVVEMVEGK